MVKYMERGNFGTKIGVVLATAGSAVGLGNIWRFPYMTGHDGGAAFIMVYLACVLVLGIPGMVAEFVVGRHGAANAARAYTRAGGSKAWGAVGFIGALTSLIILGFYSVIAGWCLQYLFASIMGNINGDAAYVQEYFKMFSSSPIEPVVWTIAFIILTHLVVVRGIRKGIEKVSNILMPTLFILLLVIVAASCTLPDAGKGINFLFKPDFSKIDHQIIFDGLGQAFFSLSLGTACLCTYASYFTRQTNLLKSSVQVVVVDTLVAILAGLMIFPAAFSVGVNPDSGPSLIFITLPNVFQQAFASVPAIGYVISLLFFLLLSLAALTSLISLHEVSTAFFQEELHISRKRAALLVTVTASVIGTFCSLSLGAYEGFVIFQKPLFDWFDFITGQIFLPVVGFLTCIFIGWYVDHKIVRDEFTNDGTLSARYFHRYLFLVKYVCPLAILFIFLHQLGVI